MDFFERNIEKKSKNEGLKLLGAVGGGESALLLTKGDKSNGQENLDFGNVAEN